jgi:hypothetical protein
VLLGDMVGLRDMCVNTLHKGDSIFTTTTTTTTSNNNNNNNNKRCIYRDIL